MIPRHALLVLLLVCGLLSGQGLVHRHGIVHAGWSAHASSLDGSGLPGTPSDDDRADPSDARCTIPDGAVPIAALPPYRVVRPVTPDASPERPVRVLRPLPTRPIVHARARAPPLSG